MLAQRSFLNPSRLQSLMLAGMQSIGESLVSINGSMSANVFLRDLFLIYFVDIDAGCFSVFLPLRKASIHIYNEFASSIDL